MTRTASRSGNPIARVRQTSGLTLVRASHEAGVHLQAFFLQEQGVYPEILPRIGGWALKRGEIDMDFLILEYHVYQKEKREAFGESYGLPIFELGPPDDTNPFVDFREVLDLSRMGFAKRFCVHPGLLYRVENGISQSLPEQLADALRDAGVKPWVLSELDFRIREQHES